MINKHSQMPSVSPSQRLSGIRSFVPESGSNKVFLRGSRYHEDGRERV